MNKIQADRLRVVVQALRESKVKNKDFTMQEFGTFELDEDFEPKTCGTPACALGHFASRRDLQSFLRLETPAEVSNYCSDVLGIQYVRKPDRWGVMYDADRICNYFGITVREAEEIFGPYGCNEAKGSKSAALYIERFIKRTEGIPIEERRERERESNPFYYPA